MPAVDVQVTKIHYEKKDAKTGGARAPIVFIHGSGGNAGMWRKLMGEMGSRTTLAIDLPGHGGSGGEGMRSIREYSAFVMSFLDALGLEKTVIAGHSMGGGVVLDFSLLFPERLESIMLIGTGARLRVLPEALEMNRKMAFGEMESEFTPWAFAENAPAEVIAEGKREWQKTGALVRYYDFVACDKFDIMSDVDKIQTPALVVCGSEDRLTPVKYSEFLKRKIARAKMEVIPGSGHMVMMENPRALAGVILEYLENEERT
ncbi:MAG TPA: alpha/beta hydrolase [Thermodesulfobacteriota bacterium]|nr:alpha/beta hydrolase [Thermodesulfobacteriota bacterium]